MGIILMATGLLTISGLVYGQEMQDGKKDKFDKKQPIQITSDVLEAFNDKRLAVFSGNAVAVQGDLVIRSDKLLIYYKKAAGVVKPKEAKEFEQMGDLDRIEAKGKVSIAKGTRVATGDEAVFDQDAQKITMTGNTVMREGNNVIRGNKITLLMDENRGIVEAQERKRVTATFYPSEKKDAKETKDSRK